MSKRDFNPELYVMNDDGSNQTNLTNVLAPDVEPVWSPDGSKIAFVSDRDLPSEIYVMNADGSNITRLTNNFKSDRDPSWPPDGTKIVYVSDPDNVISLVDVNMYEIFVMNANGSNPVWLTDNDRYESDPAWSPDGTKIAFTSDRDAIPEVYVMVANGGEQAIYVRVTTTGENYSSDNDIVTVMLGHLTAPIMAGVRESDEYHNALDVVWAVTPEQQVNGDRILRGAAEAVHSIWWARRMSRVLPIHWWRAGRPIVMWYKPITPTHFPCKVPCSVRSCHSTACLCRS